MMIASSRTLLLSAALTAALLAAAMAQPNDNPAGNYDSNRPSPVTPGTANNGGKFGMNTGDAGSSGTTGANAAATSGTMPGNSGRTLVAPSQTSQPDATTRMMPSQSGNGNRDGQ